MTLGLIPSRHAPEDAIEVPRVIDDFVDGPGVVVVAGVEPAAGVVCDLDTGVSQIRCRILEIDLVTHLDDVECGIRRHVHHLLCDADTMYGIRLYQVVVRAWKIDDHGVYGKLACRDRIRKANEAEIQHRDVDPGTGDSQILPRSCAAELCTLRLVGAEPELLDGNLRAHDLNVGVFRQPTQPGEGHQNAHEGFGDGIHAAAQSVNPRSVDVRSAQPPLRFKDHRHPDHAALEPGVESPGCGVFIGRVLAALFVGFDELRHEGAEPCARARACRSARHQCDSQRQSRCSEPGARQAAPAPSFQDRADAVEGPKHRFAPFEFECSS